MIDYRWRNLIFVLCGKKKKILMLPDVVSSLAESDRDCSCFSLLLWNSETAAFASDFAFVPLPYWYLNGKPASRGLILLLWLILSLAFLIDLECLKGCGTTAFPKGEILFQNIVIILDDHSCSRVFLEPPNLTYSQHQQDPNAKVLQQKLPLPNFCCLFYAWTPSLLLL